MEGLTTSTESWAPAPSLIGLRWGNAAATAQDGRIFAAGGIGSEILSTVEAFDPRANAWRAVASMPTARIYLAAAVGGDGRLYALGGWTGAQALGTAEAYSP